MTDERLLEISRSVSIPMDSIQFTYVRSSGPGGQNVNKVASKAVLRWNLAESALPDDAKDRFMKRYPSYLTGKGEVVLTAQRYRDAPKNRDSCLAKLQAMIAESLKKPKKRIPTKPTAASIRRRLNDKAKRSETKERRKPVQPGD